MHFLACLKRSGLCQFSAKKINSRYSVLLGHTWLDNDVLNGTDRFPHFGSFLQIVFMKPTLSTKAMWVSLRMSCLGARHSKTCLFDSSLGITCRNRVMCKILLSLARVPAVSFFKSTIRNVKRNDFTNQLYVTRDRWTSTLDTRTPSRKHAKY